MIWLLRILFSAILVAMLCVTTWASLHVPLWDTPREVAVHPWFIACLFDAYFGFITFFVWLAWRERTHLARGLWFVALMLLGNIAMSVYVLLIVCRAPTNAEVGDLLFKRKEATA